MSTTSLTCETATLADAVMKAAKVAPNKGRAFDVAAGVALEVSPAKNLIYVKATDLDVTYLQRVYTTKSDGPDVTWRLPSALAAGVLAGFPMGSGQYVTLSADDAGIHVVSGDRKAVMQPYTQPTFPLVTEFDPTGMVDVEDLARRVGQVSWACAKDTGVLTGVHLDGKHVIGCDRHTVAFAPCVVPLIKSIAITVPLAPVGPLLRNLGTVRMRVDEHLELLLDPDTQVTSNIMAESYPNVRSILRTDFDGEFKVGKDLLTDAINRMLVLVRGERYPSMDLALSTDSLHLTMEVPGVGRMDDTLAVEGGTDFKFRMAPGRLLDAVAAASRQETLVKYGPTNLKPLQFTDGEGYECWVMPINPGKVP